MNAYRRNGVQALLRIGCRLNSKGGIVSIHCLSVMIALLSLCLAAPGQLAAQSHQDSGPGMNQTDSAVPGLHDFDFLVGQWRAHHRKLKQRLANNHEWIEFEGTLLNQPLMGGYSNVDDTVLSVAGAPYRGVALRSFDPKTRQWSIWWLDSRTPSEPLDPPMIGGFHNGVGTFYGNDTVKIATGAESPGHCAYLQRPAPAGCERRSRGERGAGFMPSGVFQTGRRWSGKYDMDRGSSALGWGQP